MKRRRSNAPDWILNLRIIGSLIVVGSYAVFRLPHLVSVWEAAATWVIAVVCGTITLASVEELGLRLAFREETEPVWPDAIELAIAESRHAAMMPIISHGEFVEPELFTHEFHPLTPPHGVPVVEYVGRHRPREIDRDRFGQLFGAL